MNKKMSPGIKIMSVIIILLFLIIVGWVGLKYFFPSQYDSFKTKIKTTSFDKTNNITKTVNESTTNITYIESDDTNLWDVFKTFFILIIVGGSLVVIVWLILKNKGLVKRIHGRRECESIALQILNENNKFTRLGKDDYTVVGWVPFVEGDDKEPWYSFFFIIGRKVGVNKDPKTIPHQYWFNMEMSRLDPMNDNTGLKQFTMQDWLVYANDKYFKRTGVSYKAQAPPGLLDDLWGTDSEVAVTKRLGDVRQ